MTAQTRLEPNAHVRGLVEFRAGDGPMVRIPEGPVQVVLGDDSAVIHWAEEDAALNAAIPLVDYQEHLEAGRIKGPLTDKRKP